jgi:hypothetical protein
MRGADLSLWGITPPHSRMTRFFRKNLSDSAATSSRISLNPYMMMLDVRSLEFVRQKEADKNRRQTEEKKRQKEHFKDF